jgi:hypothetical protein
MSKRKVADSRRVSVLIVGVSVIAAGLTFMFKLYEFVSAASTGIVPGIVTATVLPYFLISAGFLSLAGWAYLGGHYKNVEGPKYDMLSQEEAYDWLERTDRTDELFYS